MSTLHKVSSEVISCPGRLGDLVYHAIQVNMEGLETPFVLTMALPSICCKAISGKIDTMQLYAAISAAICAAGIQVSDEEDNKAIAA